MLVLFHQDFHTVILVQLPGKIAVQGIQIVRVVGRGAVDDQAVISGEIDVCRQRQRAVATRPHVENIDRVTAQALPKRDVLADRGDAGRVEKTDE
jgi:hypothetical protein